LVRCSHSYKRVSDHVSGNRCKLPRPEACLVFRWGGLSYAWRCTCRHIYEWIVGKGAGRGASSCVPPPQGVDGCFCWQVAMEAAGDQGLTRMSMSLSVHMCSSTRQQRCGAAGVFKMCEHGKWLNEARPCITTSITNSDVVVHRCVTALAPSSLGA
jgi:hypothetical protein